MKLKDPLVFNIVLLILILTVIQCLFILTTHWLFGTKYLVFFLYLCPLTHVAIFFTLLFLKDLFIYSESGERLKSINISNILSIFRASSAPSLLYLFLSANKYRTDLTIFIIVFTSIVFLTDLFDGYLARKLKQITDIGKYLDSSSDYMILFLACFVFLWYGKMQKWFFFLLLIRLIVVVSGNIIIFLKYGRIPYKTSFLGKMSVFAVMVYFGVNIFRLTIDLDDTVFPFLQVIPVIVLWMENIIAILLIATILEKISIVFKTANDLKKGKV